jgi:hypothetical protein
MHLYFDIVNVLKDRDWSTVSCVDGLVERDSRGFKTPKGKRAHDGQQP